MRRASSTALALIGVVILFIASSAYVVLATERGSAWALRIGTGLSPVPIAFDGMKGTLLDGLRFERIELATETVAIEALGVAVDLDWTRSLTSYSSLVFESVAIGELKVDRRDRDEPPVRKPIDFKLPKLPIEIEFITAQVDRLTTNLLDAVYHPSLAFGAHLGADVWRLSNLELRAEAVRAQGGFEVSIGESMPVQGRIGFRLPERDLRGDATLGGDMNSLRIDADLEVPQPMRATARLAILGREVVGLDAEVFAETVTYDPIVAAGFEADVHAEFGSPLTFETHVRSTTVAWATRSARNLQLAISGNVDAYALTADAAVLVPNLPDAAVKMNASGSRVGFDSAGYSIATDSGSLEGTAQAVFAPLSIEMQTRIDGFDPGYFVDFLSGALSGEATVRIERDAFSVHIGDLSGTLNDQPIQMRGSLSRQGTDWIVDDFVADAGPNSISATGRWGEAGVEISGSLDAPQVGSLYPDLGGDVRGEFSARGVASAPDIRLSLDAGALTYRGAQIERAKVRATVAGGRITEAAANAASVRIADVALQDVTAAGSGRVDAFNVTTGFRIEADETQLKWKGAWRDGELDLDLLPNGRVAAAGEVLFNEGTPRLRWAEGALSVTAHCWRRLNGAGQLCIESLDLAESGRLSGSLVELPVAALTALAPQLPGARGILGGRWNFERNRDGDWRGEAELHTERLALLELGSPDDEPVEVPDIAAIVKMTAAGVELRAAMGEQTDGIVTMDLAIDGYGEDAPLRGHVAVNAANLAPLSRFSRRVGDVAGSLRGRFELAGTRSLPRVDGKVEFVEGRFVWLDPHLEINDLAIDITMPEPQRIEVRGSGVTERGRVEIAGMVVDPFLASRQASFDIDATKVDVGLPEGKVRVNAKLQLDAKDSMFDLTGKVEVPRARIALAELPESSVRRSRDVVVVDRVVEKVEVTRLAVDLNLSLGDDVRFEAFGLKTRLAGNLRLRQARDGGVRLNGTLTLKEGEFGAFGQTLTIESGRLLFTGPAEDPRVTARAVRIIEEPSRAVRVGVDIQGRTGAVESTLFSSPAMPEADILSYLVLGRPLSAASAQESGDITGAAVALGLKGAAPVIDEIRGAFGLEELTATGGSSEELAVIAGKRISDRIYVRYSYQTFSRMSALLVRLVLNNRLSLEATAAESPAMDLIYRVGPES